MQRVAANLYTGFDGGAKWDGYDHKRGGGEQEEDRPWYKGGQWYAVKMYQHTWWHYVQKNNGEPVREREGRRHFYRRCALPAKIDTKKLQKTK